jgi:hypothetical protein
MRPLFLLPRVSAEIDCAYVAAKLADPAVTERTNRLLEKPAQFRDRLRLAAVLSEIEVDERGQRRCLHQSLLPPELVQGAFQRLGRRLLRCEAAPLHAPRAATANPIAIRPGGLCAPLGVS